MPNCLRISALVLWSGMLVAGLAACSPGTSSTEATAPATVELDEVTGLGLVKLTPEAVGRIGLETATVEQSTQTRDGSSRLAVSYSSVIYDNDGETWVYTSPEAQSFRRQPITIDYIDGNTVILTNGPAPGTVVVTVGAVELYGAETGIGK